MQQRCGAATSVHLFQPQRKKTPAWCRMGDGLPDGRGIPSIRENVVFVALLRFALHPRLSPE